MKDVLKRSLNTNTPINYSQIRRHNNKNVRNPRFNTFTEF